MDLRPTGSDIRLEIRTGKVNIVIKGKMPPSAPDATAVSSLSVIGAAVEFVKLQGEPCLPDVDGSLGAPKGDPSVQSIRVLPMFFEQTDYEIVIESVEHECVSLWHENYAIRDNVSAINESGSIITGMINFGSNVGFSDFEVSINGKKHMILRVEVYPSIPSYKEDYRQMMADITNEVYGVAIDFFRETYRNVRIGDECSTVPAVFFSIISAIFDDFMRAASRIVAAPHHKPATEHRVMPCHRIRSIDRSTDKWIRRHPECVTRTSIGIAVSKAPAVRKTVTYNTTENRFAKRLIRETISRLHDFEQRYIQTADHPDAAVLEKTRSMQNALGRLVSLSFLKDVEEDKETRSMSSVFKMALSYRELFKYGLMLRQGLQINGDVFRLSMKETAQLYEYWCFIKLVSIMKRHYRLVSSDVIRIDNSGITVTLVKGIRSEIRFINPRTGERMILSYDPGEQNTQTVKQKPGCVLTLEKLGSRVPYQYVFDARYRMEAHPDVSDPDAKIGPRSDDINTMHGYRDSIVYASPSRCAFEKTMFGAYVLFPYANEEAYVEHPFYKSIEHVNIGGLPFLPGATSLVERLLTELVADSDKSAFERTALPRGMESKLKCVDWKHNDVLVGSIRSQEQLDINLRERFYHTPAKYIEASDFPIRQVAIYQSSRYVDCGIRYYADVLTVSKVKRGTIPVPSRGNGNEDYYMFTLGEWHELKTPISVNTDYVGAPRFTNAFLLQHSESAYELFHIHSDEEYRLLYELKRVFSKVSGNEESGVIRVDDACAITVSKEFFKILNDCGEIMARYPVADFKHDPRNLFRHIKEDVAKASGEKTDF